MAYCCCPIPFALSISRFELNAVNILKEECFVGHGYFDTRVCIANNCTLPNKLGLELAFRNKNIMLDMPA